MKEPNLITRIKSWISSHKVRPVPLENLRDKFFPGTPLTSMPHKINEVRADGRPVFQTISKPNRRGTLKFYVL